MEYKLKTESAKSFKGWITRYLNRAEASLDSYESFKSTQFNEEVKQELAKADEEIKKLQNVYFECMTIKPEEIDNLNQSMKKYEDRYNDLDTKYCDAKKKIAKGISGSRSGTSPTSTSVNGTGRCKPNMALKPECLDIGDTPAKLRTWKEDFKSYFTSSEMDKATLTEQQAYFRACLSIEMKEKVRHKMEDLPIFSDKKGEETCFSLLDGIYMQVYPLVKRRQHYFELMQQAGQKTSDFLDKLTELSKEADIDKLTPTDNLVFRCIQGMHSNKNELKEKILEVEKLDLETLKKRIHAEESAKSCLDSLSPKYAASKSAANPAGKPQVKCHICTGPHFKRECKYPHDVKCHQCSGRGHVRAACPKKSQGEKSRSSYGQKGQNQFAEEATENSEETASTMGVRVRSCRVEAYTAGTKSAVKKTPRIDVMITSEGAKPMARRGLPDTGADINIMSNDWATEQGLRVDKTDKIKVYAADDEQLKIRGTTNVELDYQGLKAKAKVYVSPSMKQEFLVSCETLKAMKIIHPDFPDVVPKACREEPLKTLHKPHQGQAKTKQNARCKEYLRPAAYERIDLTDAELKRQVTRDENKNNHDRRAQPLPLASIGTQVMIQDPSSKLWSKSGIVKGIFRNGRTYLVEMPNGKEYYRNRKYIKIVK